MRIFSIAIICLVISADVDGQTNANRSFNSPAATMSSAMRPIGSPSAVDQFRNPLPNQSATTARLPAQLRETAYNSGVATAYPGSINAGFQQNIRSNTSGVRQVAMQMGLPTMDSAPPAAVQGSPPAGFNPPPISGPSGSFGPPASGFPQPGNLVSPSDVVGPSIPAQIQTVPNSLATPNSFGGSLPRNTAPSTLGRSLPANNFSNSPLPTGDLAPLAPPALSGNFATASNSCFVTGPSNYSAAFANGCSANPYGVQPIGYIAPPAQIAAPAILPNASLGAAPATPLNNVAPAGALLNFGQLAAPVQVGPGIVGQPKAYVQGQPVRNWLRYLTP